MVIPSASLEPLEVGKSVPSSSLVPSAFAKYILFPSIIVFLAISSHCELISLTAPFKLVAVVVSTSVPILDLMSFISFFIAVSS